MIDPDESCEYCGNDDHPSWLDEFPPDCERSFGKFVYMTVAEGQEHVESLHEDGSPDAYYYQCDWLLSCPTDYGMGCGREYPGTEHYHVASSPVSRRDRRYVAQSDGTPHREARQAG